MPLRRQDERLRGLIPNLFPEGETDGRYHTADATLWFFHAIERYVALSGDRETLRALLPLLTEIVERHLKGTRFGIGVDPRDGLLRQGVEGIASSTLVGFSHLGNDCAAREGERGAELLGKPPLSRAPVMSWLSLRATRWRVGEVEQKGHARSGAF